MCRVALTISSPFFYMTFWVGERLVRVKIIFVIPQTERMNEISL